MLKLLSLKVEVLRIMSLEKIVFLNIISYAKIAYNIQAC